MDFADTSGCLKNVWTVWKVVTLLPVELMKKLKSYMKGIAPRTRLKYYILHSIDFDGMLVFVLKF